MTTYNKATLKTFFETADVPTGTDYANLIDSYINIVETSAQAMAGALQTTKLITPLVSAFNINATVLTVTSANINGGNISIPGGAVIASAGTFSSGVQALVSGTASYGFQANAGTNTNLTPILFDARATNIGSETTLTGFQFGSVALASGATITTITGFSVNAPSFGVAASANTVRGINISNLGINARMSTATGITIASQAGAGTTNQCINCATGQFVVDGFGAVLNGVATTSASGTALGTAAPLSYNNIVRGIGVVDGAATGFQLLANKTGLTQDFLYESAASANLWPPGADYRINTLTSGAPFPLVANTTYRIIYKTASAYAVS